MAKIDLIRNLEEMGFMFPNRIFNYDFTYQNTIIRILWKQLFKNSL